MEGEFHLPIESIATYGDHRMAMAFGVLGVLGRVTIENGGVVYKSYPDFWSDMRLLGFKSKVHYR
jgi:3-phosphoshikimate 1-carboxyvinyltransferase